MFQECVGGLRAHLEVGDGLLSRDGGKVVQELVQRVAGLQVIHQVLTLGLRETIPSFRTRAIPTLYLKQVIGTLPRDHSSLRKWMAGESV
jgi:hypothetical protein